MSPSGWSGDFQHLQACTQNCGNFYLSKITRLQGSLDTAMSVPLDLPARFLQGLRRLHSFLFSPNTSFTLQPIEQGWDIEESWQQCCVFWLWSTSVSQSYKRVRAPWLQGYFHSCQPAEDDGSPSFSPLLHCIFNTSEFCSSGLGWRSFRTWSIGRKRLFGNETTWEGECPG